MYNKSMKENTGVKTARYEPQAGKDICDRRIAAIKSHMHRFVNEGNDMKAAIQSYGEIKGCYAAVCLAQASAQTMTKHTMAGVQGLHNFSYENGGMRVWRAYDVGPGKFYTRPSWPGLEHPKVPWPRDNEALSLTDHRSRHISATLRVAKSHLWAWAITRTITPVTDRWRKREVFLSSGRMY